MYDLSQPVPTEVIVGSIVFIFAVIGVGLLVVGSVNNPMSLFYLIDTEFFTLPSKAFYTVL